MTACLATRKTFRRRRNNPLRGSAPCGGDGERLLHVLLLPLSCLLSLKERIDYSFGSILRIAFSSALATIEVERSRRLRLVSFLVRMWLWNACLRLMRPLPVARNRLAAPRFDFILGMAYSYW